MDCASAILTVLINGEKGQAYTISNKDSIASIREAVEAMARSNGTEIVFSNPKDAEKQGYNLMDNSALDAGKLEGLGWRAQFDLAAGTANSIKFFNNSQDIK